MLARPRSRHADADRDDQKPDLTRHVTRFFFIRE
jgi:hypothetical protein